MAIDEGIRARIHHRLGELLGTEEANALMSSLTDPEQAATKADLGATEERLNGRMDGLEHRMERLEVRVNHLEERFTLKLEASEARTGERIADLKSALLERMSDQAATFTRSTVIAVVSSVIAMGGLTFGARLL